MLVGEVASYAESKEEVNKLLRKSKVVGKVREGANALPNSPNSPPTKSHKRNKKPLRKT
ncbi:MAG: hypothetical protein ACTSYM_03265 [Candidatus Baldrarchaeia archaeon]